MAAGGTRGGGAGGVAAGDTGAAGGDGPIVVVAAEPVIDLVGAGVDRGLCEEVLPAVGGVGQGQFAAQVRRHRALYAAGRAAGRMAVAVIRDVGAGDGDDGIGLCDRELREVAECRALVAAARVVRDHRVVARVGRRV